MMEKRCSRCYEVKPLCDFNKSCTGKYGHHSYCRVCQRDYTHSRPRERREYNRQYYWANVERLRKQGRERKAKDYADPEKRRKQIAASQRWIVNNRERFKEIRRRYQERLKAKKASNADQDLP